MLALLARGSIWDAYCFVVNTDCASEFSKTYCSSLQAGNQGAVGLQAMMLHVASLLQRMSTFKSCMSAVLVTTQLVQHSKLSVTIVVPKATVATNCSVGPSNPHGVHPNGERLLICISNTQGTAHTELCAVCTHTWQDESSTLALQCHRSTRYPMFPQHSDVQVVPSWPLLMALHFLRGMSSHCIWTGMQLQIYCHLTGACMMAPLLVLRVYSRQEPRTYQHAANAGGRHTGGSSCHAKQAICMHMLPGQKSVYLAHS